MRSIIPLFLLGLALVSPFAVSSAAFAEDSRIGSLVIGKPWARASIGTGHPAAAYFTITNEGQGDDRVTGLETPLAESAKVHLTVNDGGVMKMLPVEDLAIGPGEILALKPGGLHVMLIGLREPLKEGGFFPLTVAFEKAGRTTLQVPVAGPGAKGPPK